MAAKKKEKAKAAAKEGSGVIATILQIITEKGPISKADILKALSKKFPDREPEKMAVTIKAQLTGKDGNRRIEKGKSIKLSVNDDGEFSVKGAIGSAPAPKAQVKAGNRRNRARKRSSKMGAAAD